jgi:hypothetical protein
MKKLILIQNDFAGAGKSTVVRLLRRYLNQHHVPHQFIVMDEEESSIEPDAIYLNPSHSAIAELTEHVDNHDITLVEVATGMGEVFAKLYEQHELYNILPEMEVEITVILPVTNTPESFDAVTEAAETFSDNVQYLIAHNTTSAYDEDDGSWDASHAARVMDMFEAVELRFPEAGAEMENTFRAMRTNLPESLLQASPETVFGKEYNKWLKRSMGQVEAARQYLFGDNFRTLAEVSAPAKRGRKAMAKA